MVRDLVRKLHSAGQSPNSIRNAFNIVKKVVASAKNEKGEELLPRKWDLEFIDLPLILEDDLRRPTFTVEEVNEIVAEPGK